MRLNRRTAPSLYLGVRPVTRESSGALALGGHGVPIDFLVEMVRFDQETLFDRLAESHRLDPGLMEGLADAIVRLHAIAEPRWITEGATAWRGSSTATLPVSSNRAHRSLTPPPATSDGRCSRQLAHYGERLDDRRRRGLVRECHGDLHLRNICLLDGLPTLFDAVEFNDDISCIDVAYDLAFLLMDLWRRRLPVHANLVFNEYLTRTDDLDSLALLPLFLSCRAGVRAMTSATAAKVQSDERQQRIAHAAAREYLTLAEDLLRSRTPCLIAIGGFSGSGKSTLAQAMAPTVGAAPGALILRSDVIRKMQLGVSPLTRLAAGGYAQDITARVYRTVTEHARTALEAGHSVITDAVYARPADRLDDRGDGARAGRPLRRTLD